MTRRSVLVEEVTAPLVPYTEAVRRVCQSFSALPPCSVEVSAALGLVLAEDVVSEIDVPPFANSAMDGYAIRSQDTTDASISEPVCLSSTSKVMTGRPLPVGCDAVVPWEDADLNSGAIKAHRPVQSGAYVRPVGEDLNAGDTVMKVGSELSSVHLGVLAAIGRREVRITPRPRVAVLSTGDELVAAGDHLREGKVYDANTVMLPARLCEAQAEVGRVARLGDDRELIASWLHTVAQEVDVIVTTGGASVGEQDWLRDILRAEGTLDLWRVAMRPGKPFGSGSVDGTPVFILPGNPASVLACAHAFVLPALRILSGRRPEHESVEANLAVAVKAPGGRTFLCPVFLKGSDAVPALAGSSSVLSNHLDSDGFAVVPAGGLDAGAAVIVELRV